MFIVQQAPFSRNIEGKSTDWNYAQFTERIYSVVS